MKTFLLILFVVVIAACSSKTEKQSTDDILEVQSNLEIELIEFDTILSSSDGFFRYLDEEFYYFDVRFSTVQVYSKEGNFKNSSLGKGEGPNEIASFKYHNFGEDGRSIFLATNYQISEYSSKKNHQFNWTLVERKMSTIVQISIQLALILMIFTIS